MGIDCLSRCFDPYRRRRGVGEVGERVDMRKGFIRNSMASFLLRNLMHMPAHHCILLTARILPSEMQKLTSIFLRQMGNVLATLP